MTDVLTALIENPAAVKMVKTDDFVYCTVQRAGIEYAAYIAFFNDKYYVTYSSDNAMHTEPSLMQAQMRAITHIAAI